MKKKRMKINAPEARVIQVLYQTPRSLTSNEVAEKAGVSWPTANKYLDKWKKTGIVKKEKEFYHSLKYKKKLDKIVWTINQGVFDEVMKKRLIISSSL